jgi:hypothetical protein
MKIKALVLSSEGKIIKRELEESEVVSILIMGDKTHIQLRKVYSRPVAERLVKMGSEMNPHLDYTICE